MTKRILRRLAAPVLISAFFLNAGFVAPSQAGEKSVASGQFTGVGSHAGAGTATVTVGDDGKRRLNFADFSVTRGPDLYVYLVAHENANDSKSVKNADTQNLGALTAAAGDQAYELPSGVNLEEYRSVVIWCRQFGVNFAVAPLKP